MGITYSEKDRIIHIYNKEISYVIGINSLNILEHLYFGKRIHTFNKKEFMKMPDHNFQFYKDDKFQHVDSFFENVTRVEVGTYLRNDLKPSSFIVTQNNDSLTDFRFVRFEIGVTNKYEEWYPHSRNIDTNDNSLMIELKDARRDVYLYLYYTLLENDGVLIRSSKIVNKTNDVISVDRIMSCTIDFNYENQKLIHFPGQWANERNVVEEDISYGLKKVYSLEGRSGHLDNPFFIIKDKDTNDDYGNCYSFNLIYSGNFTNEIFVSSFDGLRVNVGINDDNFNYLLNVNEEFNSPEVLICYSSNGLNELSQTNHEFILNHILTDKNIKKPILFNSWEGTGMDFTTESIKDYLKVAKKIGSELFVLDDGWFSTRNDDLHGLGDWKINTSKINLKEVDDYCHSLGMKFGIWIEPEMVNIDTEIFKDENILSHPKLEKRYSRNQIVLDFSNDDVVNNVLNQITESLKDIKVDYIKYDMNRFLGDIYSLNTRQGEIYHKYVLGVYKFMDKLLKAFPNMLFENCSSGGGRFDLGMFYFSPQIWTSDETNPVRRLYIQYGTSYGYPLQIMSSHVSKALGTYESKAMIAFFGTYGYEMNPLTLSDKDIDLLKEYNKLFKRYHKNVIDKGTYYRLLSPYDSNYGSFMCVNKNKTTALVLYHPLKKETSKFRFLKLKGLIANAKYEIDNEVYSGDYLMNVGINMSYFLEQNETRLFVVKKVKD